MEYRENDKKIEGYAEILEKHLASFVSEDGKIYEAVRYSLLGGGKRMRPLCLLAAAGPDPSGTALDFACAIEMIHAYSLIHDDLPALDNDSLRRGRPTSHVVFGEALAILAGDALLNLAYETMTQACISCKKPNALQAMGEISRAAGINGMIGGQVLDILNTATDAKTLRYIHEHKTAALIRASISAGALLGDACEAALEKYRRGGLALGLAFQIMDDILDVIGKEATLGKPIGSDERNKKLTYVSLYGIEAAKTRHETLFDEAQALFGELGNTLLNEYILKLRIRIS